MDDPTFDNSSYDYKLSQGRVMGSEDGDIITIKGTYGTLTFNTSNNKYKYELDVSNPTYQQLSKDAELTESFVLTATDPKGIIGTKELKFTINGSNSSPEAEVIPTTPDELFFSPTALYKGTIDIDDIDSDGDTLKELSLYIYGQEIDTSRNGTTRITVRDEPVTVTMADGVTTYNMPGAILGELTVTISGNNCSYVFDPSPTYSGGKEIKIPVKVTDAHGTSKDLNIEIGIKSLQTPAVQELVDATEGGQAIVGTFADMSAYVSATWADVDVSIIPVSDGDMMPDGSEPILWTELPLPTNVNGMGKPDQYFESEFGTIAFFHNIGKYVLNPAPNCTTEDLELSFRLQFTGDHAHLFQASDGDEVFTINLNNTNAPELDLNPDVEGTFYQVEIDDKEALDNSPRFDFFKVGLSDADNDGGNDFDHLTTSIIYDGEVYKADENGVITVEGDYIIVSYGINSQYFHYKLKHMEEGAEIDPDVRKILALEEGESLKEVFTFSVVDKYNARVEENFEVTINGTDQAPEIIVTSGGTEGTYGDKTITGSLIIDDFEDGNVFDDYYFTVGLAGQASQRINLAPNSSTTVYTDEGFLTLTIKGDEIHYSLSTTGLDADTGIGLEDKYNFKINAIAKEPDSGLASKSTNLNFNIEQKTLTASKLPVMQTVSESSRTAISGTINAVTLSGLLASDQVASVYNGRMNYDGKDGFWQNSDAEPENFPYPDDYNSSDIGSLFTSDAGDLAFFTDGTWVLNPSGEGSVWEDTEFVFSFRIPLVGQDKANYTVEAPTFTLKIVDDPDLTPAVQSPMPQANNVAPMSLVDDVDDPMEFVIDIDSFKADMKIQGGSGNDLVKLDLDLTNINIEDVFSIDGDDGIDVLLSGIDNLDTVKDLIANDKITNMEVIVAGDNVSGGTADDVLEGLGIQASDNGINLEIDTNVWSKVENSQNALNGYVEYKNADDETTVLIQQTILTSST